MKNILVKMIDKLLGLFTSTDEVDFKNHVYKEYYKNGKLKREKPYVRGKKHGIEKEYHINGQLLSEIPYVRDEIHGICKTYLYTNGHLLKEEMWVKGRQV